MMTLNLALRQLKARYAEERAALNLHFDRMQVDLSHRIDMARNELHYLYQAMRGRDADIDDLKERLDAAVERIRSLSMEKVTMDYNRKQAIVTLNRRKADEHTALEAQYAATETDEVGKEVAV